MEAIAYERALLYKDEVAPTLYSKWQPGKVLAFLAELDPAADVASSIAIGHQEVKGESSKSNLSAKKKS